LFPKITDWTLFVLRVSVVCEFILKAVRRERPNLHVISIDEKTGIQALERLESKAPKSKGGYLRREYEYERHGTTTLIAAINVENGSVFNHTLGPTRTEIDYCNFMKRTIYKLPEMDKVVVLSDQLNTHVSESLVRWIGEMEGYEDTELGIKGQSGFLKSVETRKAFLERDFHRVQFLFTPKHCSWLNPIENWFAKVQRHVITNGNFSSVEELEQRINAYIEYYNDCLLKPLKWKFRGFNKNKKLFNINCQ